METDLFVLEHQGHIPYQLNQGIISYCQSQGLPWRVQAITWEILPIRFGDYTRKHPSRPLRLAGLIQDDVIAKTTNFKDRLQVFSASQFCQDPKAWVVHVDPSSIGRQAVDHLLQAGYQHLACWGRWEMSRRQHIYAAADEHCKELGLSLHRLILPTDVANIAEADTAFVDQLNRLPQPLGVITHQDRDAAYIRNLCLKLGVDVPNRVGVLGVDDDPNVCTLLSPELSSIRVPWKRIGEELAMTIQRVVDGSPPDERRRAFSAFGVHSRRSTDRAGCTITDPMVRRFVAQARKTALRGQGVSDILPRLGTSQPTLYRHVNKALNKSPSTYINDIRITKACDLLQESDLNLAEIAKRCGFSSANHLITAFTDRYPVTPGVWRKG